jgi:uncharacterized membrane protein YagU involved in acid resistance
MSSPGRLNGLAVAIPLHLQLDMYRPSTSAGLSRRIVQGAIAGALGSLAMNLFARIVAGDRRAHGVQPPQAITLDDDATELAGAAAFEMIGGHEPDDSEEQPLGTAAHYAFGAAMGVAYALLSPRIPLLHRGYGTLYGSLVWIVADEGLMPALGLSRGPSQLPLRTHAYALAGHVVYGAAVAAVATDDSRPVRPAGFAVS